MEKICKYVLIFVLCILPTVSLCFYAVEKEGYFVDEIWSYGLSNSVGSPHVYSISGWDSDWIEPQFFKDYIEVNPEEEFSYGSVIYNQTQDNHPPLFYLVLHTVCSFFPEKFSKWFGIVPNIFYYEITAFFLYLLMKKISGDKRLAAVTSFMWACSAGAFSCAIFIRMYMMMAMWFVILCFLYAEILLEKEHGILFYGVLALITFLGCMTHYYFYVLVFLGAGIVVVILAAEKYWKNIIKFCTANMISLLGILFVFPVSFSKIFGLDQDHGVKAYETLREHQNVISKLREFLAILNQQLFGNYMKLMLVVLVIIGFYCILRKKNILKGMLVPAVLFLLVGGYFIIVSLVAPYRVDRYIFVIYPVVVCVFCWLVDRLLICSGVSDWMAPVCLLVLSVVFSVGEYKKGYVNYLYPQEKENMEISESYKGSDCVYISNDWYLITADIPELLNYRKVRKIEDKDIPDIWTFLDPGTDEIIVYIDKLSIKRIEEVEADLISGSRMHWWEKLYYTDKCCVYRLFY